MRTKIAVVVLLLAVPFGMIGDAVPSSGATEESFVSAPATEQFGLGGRLFGRWRSRSLTQEPVRLTISCPEYDDSLKPDFTAYGSNPTQDEVVGYVWHPDEPLEVYAGTTEHSYPTFCITFTLPPKNGWYLRVATITGNPIEDEVRFNVVASGGKDCTCPVKGPPPIPVAKQWLPLIPGYIDIRHPPKPPAPVHEQGVVSTLPAHGWKNPSYVGVVHAYVVDRDRNRKTLRPIPANKRPTVEQQDYFGLSFRPGFEQLPRSDDLLLRVRSAAPRTRYYDQVKFKGKLGN